MRRLLSLFFLCMMSLYMLAVPAQRKTFTHKQNDGTILTLMLVGDENLHYYLNTETQEKMLLGDNGDFYVPTEAKLATMEKTAQERRQAINAARLQRLNSYRTTTMTPNGMRRVGTASGSMTGNKKGLVILVNFSDNAMSHTQSELYNQFNEEGYTTGGHLGSVHDFFYDQSYGQFNLTFDVVGPVTVSKAMSYYGASSSSGNDSYPATMVIEALKLVDSQVNFADYDWDGDGEVDQVYVIYAGYGEAYGASSSTIWPHEWNLYSANYYGDGSGRQTLDGVTINTYACSCELSGTSGTTLNGIGTACHEFSHCLGYPDFYDTSYAGGFGMNGWDLMDAGSYNGPNGCGEVPAGFTSYERWCAGWLTPTELSDAATITGMKPLLDSPEAYIIYNDKNSNEYILLENRQNEKWFKYVGYTYTTPHGLLAIHVDYDATAWSNDKPNNDASHQRMSIIPASGTYGTLKTSGSQKYYSCSGSQLKGHPFSGSSSYTSLTGTSNSSSGGKWFTACSTGSTTLNHEVTEISNASDGTISFLFDGGVADDGSRYTVTFNAGTGTCSTTSWKQTDFQESITLPTATSPSSDWTFLGWSTAACSEETSTKPTTIYSAGSTYQPTADATLYAIYQMTEIETGKGSVTTYYSYPSDAVLTTPTITFAFGSQTMVVGDAAKTYTATVEGSTGAVTYTSSNTNVATVDATTGTVTAVAAGTAVITATVAAVSGVSRSASTTYTLTVSMPTLTSIAVTTQPTKVTYTEGETFNKNGMVVTATYANGYTQVVTDYILTPSETTALTPSDNTVTISYTEGSVTKTTTVAITVTELPKYTVTFNAGSGTCDTKSLTETTYQGGIILPSATGVEEEWVFAGWATASVEETTTAPELLAAGTTYSPTENTTLFAVYKKTDTEQTLSYQYTTTFTAGKEYLFVSSNTAGAAYVIDAANLNTSGKTSTGTAVTITLVGDTPTIETVPSTALWTASGSTSSMQLLNGSYYMAVNSSNSGNGLYKSSTSTDVYWDDSYGLYGQSSRSTKYYYVQINNSTFSVSSTKNSSNRVYMFQKVGEQATYTYATSPKGSTVAGDLTKDGNIDSEDVTILVQILMGETNDSWNLNAADVNGDGKTDIADVTALIAKLLQK